MKTHIIYATLVVANLIFAFSLKADGPGEIISRPLRNTTSGVISFVERLRPGLKDVAEVLVITDVPLYRKQNGTSVYSDVLAHSKAEPFGDAHGRSTNAHETAHSIHNQLLNEHTAINKKPFNGFYLLNGQAAVLEEPAMKLSRIVPEIPQSLRVYRYFTYFDNQKDWDHRPLYIFDEWSAYVIGGKTAIDDLEHGIKIGNSDYVSGCLDFSIYALCTAKAIKQHNPVYYNQNKQFKAFVTYQLVQANETFLKGLNFKECQSEKQMFFLRNWLTNPDCAGLRDFAQKEFGGIWLDKATRDALK